MLHAALRVGMNSFHIYKIPPSSKKNNILALEMCPTKVHVLKYIYIKVRKLFFAFIIKRKLVQHLKQRLIGAHVSFCILVICPENLF